MKWKEYKGASIRAELIDEGMRMTKLRASLIHVMTENTKPISVDEILGRLKKMNTHVHKVSLYRELEVLSGFTIINSVFFNDHIIRYELSIRHHHHVICTNCKTIADVELTRELHGEEKRIEKETQFKYVQHSLEFFGLCKKCAVSF